MPPHVGSGADQVSGAQTKVDETRSRHCRRFFAKVLPTQLVHDGPGNVARLFTQRFSERHRSIGLVVAKLGIASRDDNGIDIGVIRAECGNDRVGKAFGQLL